MNLNQKTQNAALLALARLSAPKADPLLLQPVNAATIAHLRRLRLGALAWYNVREPSSPWRHLLSAEQIRALKNCYTGRTAGALRAHAAARLLVQTFARPPRIPFVFIKGFAASAWLYAHPALRPLGDVDLWVDPDRFDEARQRLAQAHYQGEAKNGADFVVQLRHPALPSLDLHRSLRQSQRVQLDFASVYAARQELQVDDLRVPIPGRNDMLIIQAYSLASGELVESFNAWVDLREIFIKYPNILENYALVWRIDASAMRHAIWSVLWRLGQMWPELQLDLQGIRALRPGFAHGLALAGMLPTLEEILSGRRLRRSRQLAVKTLLLQDTAHATRFLRHYAAASLAAYSHSQAQQQPK